MPFEEQTTIIGDVMENESHRGKVMEMKSLWRWNPLAGEVVNLTFGWRGDQLACSHIGEVSNSGMAMRWEITIDIGDVVPLGDVPGSELVIGDFIPHK